MRVIFPKNKFIYFKRTNFRGQKLSRFWSRKFVHPYSTPFLSMYSRYLQRVNTLIKIMEKINEKW